MYNAVAENTVANVAGGVMQWLAAGGWLK